MSVRAAGESEHAGGRTPQPGSIGTRESPLPFGKASAHSVASRHSPILLRRGDAKDVLEISHSESSEKIEIVLTADAWEWLLILQLEGRSRTVHPNPGLDLQPATLLLLDARRVTRMELTGRSRLLCVCLPCGLHPSKPRGVHLPGGVIDGLTGIGAILRRLVLSLDSLSGRLSAAEQEGLRMTLTDLALVALGNDVTARMTSPEQRSSHSLALAQLQRSIEECLSDPCLSPAYVAARNGISLRQVHRLFRQSGTSFGAFVRMRRLERCRDDLADPGLSDLPMTEIAFRWGFSDSSHFSRCFRAAFGCTARDFRLQNGCSSQMPSQRAK